MRRGTVPWRMTMKDKTKFRIFWALMFAGALLVLSQRGYSDGDDAFFYRYSHEMGFLEYLGWRYETWVGRMGGEAMVYLTFRLGLWFWRVVNALMLVLLPMGILRLAAQTTGVLSGDGSTAQTTGVLSGDGSTAQTAGRCGPGKAYRAAGLSAAVTAVAGYFLMNFMTLGYAAVWVNGSIFYTWSFTCGVWALVPFAELVFAEPARKASPGRFLYSIPCAALAAMSVEQMGAVLLVFEVLAVLFVWWKRRRVKPLYLIQTVVTLAAFAVLFLSPGNELRVASEIAHWMPEYETMAFGQHLFITLHWMISSFANENRLFLCAIWIVGGILLVRRRMAGTPQGNDGGTPGRADIAGQTAGTVAGTPQRDAGRADIAGQTAGTVAGKLRPADMIFLGNAAVFTTAALLSCAGVTLFSDLGMQYIGIASRIEQVPSLASMDGRRLFAMGWWIAALLFTLVFLWRVSARRITVSLAYLAGLASEAILFFSPTMYASGARVYYLTDLLFLYVILASGLEIPEKTWRDRAFGIVTFLGICNFAVQARDFLAWM